MSVAKHKSKGNEHFKADRFSAAVEEYSLAIAAGDADKGADPKDRAACHFNRGMCFRKLGKPTEAVDDFTQAIGLKPDYVKAWYMRAQVKEHMRQLREAVYDYQHAWKLDGANKEAHEGITRCMTLLTTAAAALKQASAGRTMTARDVEEELLKEATRGGDDDSDGDGGSSTLPSAAARRDVGDEPPPSLLTPPAAAAAAAGAGAAKEVVRERLVDDAAWQALTVDLVMPPAATLPPLFKQRFDVARLMAQYQVRGVAAGVVYAVLPLAWWQAWCAAVGGFSSESDIAPCVRLLKTRGTLNLDMDDAAVRSEYPAVAAAQAEWTAYMEAEIAAGVTPASVPLVPAAVAGSVGPIRMAPLLAPVEAQVWPPAELSAEDVTTLLAPQPAPAVREAGGWYPIAVLPDDATQPLYLRRDVLEGRDFTLVGREVASALTTWWGAAGPPLLRVAVAGDGDGAPATIDLFPELRRGEVNRARAARAEAMASAAAATPSAADKELMTCAVCEKPSTSVCTSCQRVRYCSRDCQRAHWPLHKLQCATLAAGGTAAVSLNGRMGLVNIGNTW